MARQLRRRIELLNDSFWKSEHCHFEPFKKFVKIPSSPKISIRDQSHPIHSVLCKVFHSRNNKLSHVNSKSFACFGQDLKELKDGKNFFQTVHLGRWNGLV